MSNIPVFYNDYNGNPVFIINSNAPTAVSISDVTNLISNMKSQILGPDLSTNLDTLNFCTYK